MGDFFSDSWSSVTEAYDALKKGLSNWEAYAKVEKQLERELVRTIYAPDKRNKRSSIKKEFDDTVQEIASDTKADLTKIASQLDEEIKGQFSKAIQKTIKEKIANGMTCDN